MPGGMMSEEKRYTEAELHKKFAIETFNETWNYIDKKDRTPQDDAAMMNLIHASRYHWGKVGTALEFARGDQMIAKVYATLKQPGLALRFAESCLDLCQRNGIADFDIAFAFASMSEAHSLAGNKAEALKYYRLAEQAAEQIAKQEDRDYFLSVLHELPVRSE
jgi:tetratricopeptide (TPR) repeat protein